MHIYLLYLFDLVWKSYMDCIEKYLKIKNQSAKKTSVTSLMNIASNMNTKQHLTFKFKNVFMYLL